MQVNPKVQAEATAVTASINISMDMAAGIQDRMLLQRKIADAADQAVGVPLVRQRTVAPSNDKIKGGRVSKRGRRPKCVRDSQPGLRPLTIGDFTTPVETATEIALYWELHEKYTSKGKTDYTAFSKEWNELVYNRVQMGDLTNLRLKTPHLLRRFTSHVIRSFHVRDILLVQASLADIPMSSLRGALHVQGISASGSWGHGSSTIAEEEQVMEVLRSGQGEPSFPQQPGKETRQQAEDVVPVEQQPARCASVAMLGKRPCGPPSSPQQAKGSKQGNLCAPCKIMEGKVIHATPAHHKVCKWCKKCNQKGRNKEGYKLKVDCQMHFPAEYAMHHGTSLNLRQAAGQNV